MYIVMYKTFSDSQVYIAYNNNMKAFFWCTHKGAAQKFESTEDCFKALQHLIGNKKYVVQHLAIVKVQS